MPASLKDLRSRIKSVKGTQQITKAMKLVSAAKFVKAQQNAINARSYALALARMSAKLAKLVSGGSLHALVNKSDSKVALAVVVSSERGLCGGYNANISKLAIKTINDLESEGFRVETVCVGKKAFQVLNRWRKLVLKKKEECTFVTEHDYVSNPSLLLSGSGLVSITTPFDKPTNNMAKRLAGAFEALYQEGKIGKLVVVYNKFQSAMSQIPTTDVVLPFQFNETQDEAVAEPLFEPEMDDVLAEVFSRAVTSSIFQALLEAVASEHGARMTAMDNATRNAKEMERKLQLTYQRARQAAITKELIEIISGAGAL